MLIQKFRLQRGWSQEQLAEVSGLSVRTIQRLERGQPASLETLKALGAAFGVDFSTLKEPDMTTDAAEPAATLALIDSRAEEALAMAYVRKLRGLYLHFAFYVLGITILIVINLVTWQGSLWVVYPILGWSIGVAFQWLMVTDRIPYLRGEWERRQVEKRLGRKL